MKILLAVDGSAYTQKMLSYLTSHAATFGNNNTFSVLTVGAPLPAMAAQVLSKDALNGYHTEEAEKILNPILAFLLEKGINASPIKMVGAAGISIAKAAQEGGFDLVVMGSHGHGAVMTLIMGSVATQVLAHCTVPVLLVR